MLDLRRQTKLCWMLVMTYISPLYEIMILIWDVLVGIWVRLCAYLGRAVTGRDKPDPQHTTSELQPEDYRLPISTTRRSVIAPETEAPDAGLTSTA